MVRRKFSWSAFRWSIGVVAAIDVLATAHLIVPTLVLIIVNLPAFCIFGFLIPKTPPSQFTALAIAIGFILVSGSMWGWIAGHTFAIYIPQGHCLKCSYNLTHNTTGICPECGTPIASTC